MEFEIRIPDVKKVSIPEPYTKEEWTDQLIRDAVEDRIGSDILVFYEIDKRRR